MPRKDYVRAAELVAERTLPQATYEQTVAILIALFRADNPRLDATRFRKACGEWPLP
jgi:hypothetical protein